jgi:hypothetical protein
MQKRKKPNNLTELNDFVLDVLTGVVNGDIDEGAGKVTAAAATAYIKGLGLHHNRQAYLGIKAPIKGLDDAYLKDGNRLNEKMLIVTQPKQTLLDEFTKK